jgi:hypothetical protein
LTTADDVVSVLCAKRWPDQAYVVLTEVPAGDPARQGRRADLVALGAWRSRGYEIDAVEVKVSVSDWRRELVAAAKADWWWRHAHRFWLAAPAEVAAKIEPEVPPTWGVLACGSKAVKVLHQAPRHEPEPLAWPAVIGLLRCARDAGTAALARAEARGRDMGRQQAEQRFEATNGDAHLRDQLATLRSQVEAFEAASGMKVDRWDGGERLGRLVAFANQVHAHPDDIRLGLERAAKTLEHLVGEVRGLARVAGTDLDAP